MKKIKGVRVDLKHVVLLVLPGDFDPDQLFTLGNEELALRIGPDSTHIITNNHQRLDINRAFQDQLRSIQTEIARLSPR
ncbi:hypothetical protein BG015_000948 [Linnemannia schmuckeri]|uniref:Uncharacterized protein n=1 Tax=Linnemannia schmuckeri TaxID=64567 RepID=A0A9P5RQE7_9FUNG|nr:hypothetical protein BG015_000948 [Linnemannia schmuckeri]